MYIPIRETYGNFHELNYRFVWLFLGLVLTSQINAQGGVLDLFGIINVLYLKADKNHDGIITEPELEDVYHENGQVSKSEFVTLWMEITKETKEHADAFFYLADLTDDNVIDEHDLGPMYHVFDLDGDGQVTAVEFAKKWAGIITETPLAVLFERSDVDKSNFLTKSEFNNFLSSFDKNGDGMVTKPEMEQGWNDSQFGIVGTADTFFTHLDLNHNGHIDSNDLGHIFTKYDTSRILMMADMLPPPPAIGQ
ncbi:hypothetical protein KUTeg_021606 [Tegillarca granosa]|uniref:EF-hand domain-containing protein n=1 Tax=Tegillarca granosa TaxID=220873 RepID=A0ABQ9E958_TEGGR|nr:hypothetical protein KUTeg_021606 [Tegillarca granosa]